MVRWYSTRAALLYGLACYGMVLGCDTEGSICLDARSENGPRTFNDIHQCLSQTPTESWPDLLQLGWNVTDGDALRGAFLNHYEAQLALRRGEHRRALDLNQRASEVFEERGQRPWLAASRYNLGALYSALGRGPEALVEFKAALEIYGDEQDAENEAKTLTQIGWVFFLERNEPKATEALEQALVRRTTLKGRATTLDRLGSVHREAGRHTKALKCYREALEIFEGLDEPLRGHVLANLGWLDLDGGAFGEAESKLRASLPLLRHLGDPDAEAHVLVGLAGAIRRSGRPQEALKYLERGIRIVEELRRATPLRPLRSTYLALRQDYYFDHLDLLVELDRLEPGRGYDQRAVLANEQGRARSLLDLLTLAPASGSPDSRSPETANSAELHHLRARISELQMGIFNRQRSAWEITESESEALTEALSRYEVLRGFEASGNPSTLESAPPIVGVTRVQALLDTRTTVLSYVLGEERSYLFLIDHRGLEIFTLPSRSALETVALDLYRALAEGPDVLTLGQIPQMARDLGEKVLAPVADRLGQRLIIIKDGALHWIPFAVLRSPLRPDRPLLNDHVVTAVPSLSSLSQLHRRSRRLPSAPRVAVFAPDVGPAPRRGTRAFPALRSVEAEVRTILAQVSPQHALPIFGSQATPDRLARIANESVNILHLATHGFVFRSHPELSAILLTNGQGGDELLHLHEIFDLDIPVELVVLSACETALGDLLRGEGMVSMVHAFLSAGAARTLVSLWRINDASTASLMTSFYRALIEEGLDPASALRQAQLVLVDEHPYFWAAFELQGI